MSNLFKQILMFGVVGRNASSARKWTIENAQLIIMVLQNSNSAIIKVPTSVMLANQHVVEFRL